jgi:hypothetical protein
MTRGSALIPPRHVRAAPLRVRVGSLSRLGIGTRVWVIRLPDASAAIRGRNSSASGVRSSVWIVTSPARGRSVRAISSLFPSVSSGNRIIVRRCKSTAVTTVISTAVSPWKRIVEAPITIWRPPIASPIGKDSACRSAQNERAQISRCVVRCNCAVRVSGLGNIRYIINW